MHAQIYSMYVQCQLKINNFLETHNSYLNKAIS